MIVLLVFYISNAVADNPELIVVQTTLASFTGDLLYEKSPIVITDRIVNVDELIASSFKYMYASAKHVDVTIDKQEKNKYKYMVLHSSLKGGAVLLTHPLTSESTQIIMHPHTVLVIPKSFGFVVQGAVPEKVMGLHTVLSVF